MLRSMDEGDGQNNENNIGIQLFCVACIERMLAASIFHYSFVHLCCVVPLPVHYRLCLVTVCMKVLQNGRCPIFREDRRCTFSWNACNQNSYFIRCTHTAVSKVVTAYTHHGKASSAKWNSGWKLKLSGRDHCILTGVSKSYSTVAKVTAVLNIHLEDTVSEKNSLTTASQMQSTVQLQLQNLWLLNATLKVKKWYDAHKAWMSDAWKYIIWSDEKVVFQTVPNIRLGLCLQNAQGSL